MAKDTYSIALGMIETRGLVPAIEAAGAMTKGWLPRKSFPARTAESSRRSGMRWAAIVLGVAE
ncbi:hypothetical protein NB231_15198 [Nitrococcus mobilis Nb-231]|uniref:Uncharacterized protein n=1 Tax=Nitrococcus mobilis Nb-231 TaxID=314278 RepID=A4BLJ0_9GAMM|nr:hypothetical protein NB231_15198 [Nitrococcus mobilis Nb-231]